jgi:DNA-binding CsgD family transcriptional regulator
VSSSPRRLIADTKREREILVLVAEGLSNMEIAGRVVSSPLTAKTHVGRILGKLACRDRANSSPSRTNPASYDLILLDATVIRSLLVPALVALFGRWNWWAPAWFDRILRVAPSRLSEPG